MVLPHGRGAKTGAWYYPLLLLLQTCEWFSDGENAEPTASMLESYHLM